jgi:hypothetical protein
MRHSPLSIESDSMPLLKSINLEYIFVDPPLIDFLVQHTSTLESISFEECMCGTAGLSENGVYWYNLFESLIKAKPQKLKHFEILPVEVEGLDDEIAAQNGDLELDDIGKVSKLMEEDENRRAFPYKVLDDKYGMLFEDDETNVEAFFEGKDQKAFDELMEIVRRNSSEVGR